MIRECAECKSGIETKAMQKQIFYFTERKIELCAVVPVWICDICNEPYTDYEAEMIRNSIVNRYTNLLKEIDRVR